MLLASPSIEVDGPDAVATRPFNVLLISIDTLRADRLSTYGFERRTSPRIDELAEAGVLFEQAYSQSPKTAESHMSILTSLHPEVHRVQNFVKDTTPLSAEIPTLAEILDEAGYRTEAYVGGGNVTEPLGFARGFDVFGEYTVYDRGGAAFERATEALKRLGSERTEDAPPFFMFVHTFKVHAPYAPPEGYASEFVEPGLEDAIPGQHERLQAIFDSGGNPSAEFWKPIDIENPRHMQHIDELYQAEIRYTDDRLRRMLDALDESGMGDDTLVVLLSDHGEEFGDHGYILHERLYQELLHVPLILRFPKNDPEAPEPSTRIDTVVSMIDVMPSILDYLGVDVPSHAQGQSLLPLIRGEEERPRVVWSQWYESSESAVRVGDWKLYHRNAVEPAFRLGRYSFFWDEREWEELYELGSDPREQKDLIGSEPDAAAALNEMLERLRVQRDALRDHFGRGETVELEEETKRQLEALGYL